ncbi:MAG: hypothetical protein QOG45_1125 [Chloroflexota bacterium]|nr:hypothetical protein [Chloroflexota bacterium]
MDRRSFLTLTGTLAGTLLLPTMKGSPAALDGLHRRAQHLAAGARSQRPTTTLAEAGDLVMVAEAAFLAAVPRGQRQSLHRTASLAALTAAQAAQRAKHPAGTLLDRAHGHAAGAGDGPLKAQVLVLKRDEEAAARHRGAGSAASVRMLTAALDAAGSSRETASLRASILYRLAWECAALGDVHGALQELEGADASAAMATVSPDVVEDVDLRCGGAEAWRGKCLRMARCPSAAETALAKALGTRVQPAGVLVDIARVRADAGDVDGAVAALEDGFLVARTAENRRIEASARHAAGTLPDTPAVRSLRELIRS